MNIRNFVNLYQLIFVIFSLCSVQGDDYKRTINYQLNPGCDNQFSQYNINIGYIQAKGPNDVLHLLYAGGNFTKTLSSIIIRSSNLESKVTVNCTNLINQNNTSLFDSYKLIGDSYPSIFAVIFTKLYASHDSGNLEWNFSDFEWDPINKIEENEKHIIIQFRAAKFNSNATDSNKHNIFGRGSYIYVNFTYENSMIPNTEMPRLTFTSNNTQFNLILYNLSMSEYKKVKFTFQYALANRYELGNMSLKNIKSIDDESSPGVFRVLNFYGQDSNAKEENTTYVQWKPVCYSIKDDHSLRSILSVNNSNPVKVSQDVNLTTIEIIKKSLAYIVLQDSIIMPNSYTSMLNVTFGDIDDAGYSNYSIWTASFGYGVPPKYELSLTIIMIICFGLGVPFIIVVGGSIYLVIKKRLRHHRLTYVSIDEHIN